MKIGNSSKDMLDASFDPPGNENNLPEVVRRVEERKEYMALLAQEKSGAFERILFWESPTPRVWKLLTFTFEELTTLFNELISEAAIMREKEAAIRREKEARRDEEIREGIRRVKEAMDLLAQEKNRGEGVLQSPAGTFEEGEGIKEAAKSRVKEAVFARKLMEFLAFRSEREIHKVFSRVLKQTSSDIEQQDTEIKAGQGNYTSAAAAIGEVKAVAEIDAGLMEAPAYIFKQTTMDIEKQHQSESESVIRGMEEDARIDAGLMRASADSVKETSLDIEKQDSECESFIKGMKEDVGIDAGLVDASASRLKQASLDIEKQYSESDVFIMEMKEDARIDARLLEASAYTLKQTSLVIEKHDYEIEGVINGKKAEAGGRNKKRLDSLASNVASSKRFLQNGGMVKLTNVLIGFVYPTLLLLVQIKYHFKASSYETDKYRIGISLALLIFALSTLNLGVLMKILMGKMRILKDT